MIEKLILLNQKPKKNLFILLATLIIISLVISSYFIKTYDVYKTYGYITCDDNCYINLSLSYDNLNKLTTKTLLEIDKEITKIDDIEYLDISLENEIPYQNVRIKTVKDKNKIIEIKLLNNKQRIIKKLYDLIKEG